MKVEGDEGKRKGEKDLGRDSEKVGIGRTLFYYYYYYLYTYHPDLLESDGGANTSSKHWVMLTRRISTSVANLLAEIKIFLSACNLIEILL